MPDTVPMAVRGRLAIDRSMQGRGLGVALLQDAALRVRLEFAARKRGRFMKTMASSHR